MSLWAYREFTKIIGKDLNYTSKVIVYHGTAIKIVMGTNIVVQLM